MIYGRYLVLFVLVAVLLAISLRSELIPRSRTVVSNIRRLKMNEITGLISRCSKFHVTCNAAGFSSAKFVVGEAPPLQIFLKM